MLSADSHASKRKNLQPKKRSVRKVEETLSEVRKKKKKVEEAGIISSDQKQKQIQTPGLRIKEKTQASGPENFSNQTPSTFPGLHSGNCSLLASHSNGSIKVS